MATPAAVLSIMVKAQGVQAASAQLGALDKSGRSAASGLAKAESGAKKAGGTFSTLKTTAVSAGAAVGVAGLAKGVSSAISEFREAQKVGAQTNAVLRSTGGAAKVTAQEVGNLATAISNKTGIDDEAIQKGANLLLTFKNVRNEAGRGRDIFNQATRAAVDLSAAGFGSLESTSKQLGKALNDPVKGLTALGRSGVTFSAQQKTAIAALVETGRAADRVKAQQIILREVQSQVGGSAAAQATNADKLRVALGNVAETAGGVLVPVLDKAAAVLLKVNEAIGPAGWLILIGVLGTLAASVFAVNAAVKIYAASQVAVTAATWLWNTALAANAGAITIATGGLNLIIPAMVALGVALVVAYKKSETFRNIVNGAFSAVKGFVVGAIDRILGGFSSMLTAIGKVARAVGQDGLGNKALQGARAIDDLRDSLRNVPDKKNVDVTVKITLDGQDVDVTNAKPLSPTPPGGDGPGVIGSKIADKVRQSQAVKDKAKALVTDGLGSMIPGIGGGKVGSLMGASASLRPFAAVGAQFGLHVSDGKRPAGTKTSTGGVSYHSSGQAIDLANGRGPDAAKMAAFNALRSRYGSRLAELIYSPAGGRQIKDGHNFLYGEPVRSDHFDHVHVAFTGGTRASTAMGQAGNRGDGLGRFMGDGPGLSGINLAIDAARKAGFTGEALVRMVAIAGRESNYNPRAQNLVPPDHSIGLWQINQLAHHGRFGSDAALMNPYTNARAAWTLSGHGHNFSPWSTNRGLSGALLKRARAAVAAFKGGTSTGGGGNSAAGSTGPTGAASTVEKVNPLDQKLATADLAIEMAKRGSIKAPGLSGRRISSSLQQIQALTGKRQLIGARIRSIRKALKTKKLSGAKRLALTQELTQRLSEHAQLGADISDLRQAPGATDTGAGLGGGDVGGGLGGDTGEDPNQGLIDAIDANTRAQEELQQATIAHQQAVMTLNSELQAQRNFAQTATATQNAQAWRALADIMSGQLGGYGGVASRSLTAGGGSVVRY